MATTDGSSSSQRLAGHNQELFSKYSPKPGECDINANEKHRIFRCRHHGERQKTWGEHIDLVTFDLHGLTERSFSQINMVIIEIPVLAVQVFNIGSDGDQPAARF